MRFLILFFSFLYANIVSNSNFNVLKSLDIDERFLSNSKLQQKYKIYSKYRKEYFLNVLENGFYILPIIKEEVISSKIPKALINVALAESYLKLSAKSHKKASGLWQFIPSTARRFGLRIDEYVDERNDPIKSTKAAIKYLEYLHNFFGKWYLAIMAYNAGEARIVEGVVRAKVDKIYKSLDKKTRKKYRQIIKNYQRKKRNSFKELYKLYKKLSNVNITLSELMRYQKGLSRQYIPKETRDYILKILAISFLLNQDDFINYSNSYILNSGTNSNYVKVNVAPGTSLYYVAKILDIDYKALRYHNMHIKNSFTPPYPYYIYIPYNKLALFKLKYKPKRHYFYIYYVKKGDTLIKIAKRFHTKVKLIKDFNKIGKYLRVGEKLIIPLNEMYIKYKVKKGDTLGKIAKKFNVSIKKIKEVNNLKNDIIKVGETLKIPQRL